MEDKDLFDIISNAVDEMFENDEVEFKCCGTCANCVPIGDGDHICIADEPILVMSDYEPTENYNYCNECDWEEM